MTDLKYCYRCDSWHEGKGFEVKNNGVKIGCICEQCNKSAIRKIIRLKTNINSLIN
jgi:hypothetical protein